MKTKKKIYITALHLRHGGVEMMIASYANAFAELGYDVEILCIYDFKEIAYDIDSRVKIRYLTDVLPNKKELKEAISKGKPVSLVKEVIHAMRVIRLKKSSMKKAISSIDCGVIISTRNEHSVLLSRYGREGVLKIAQLHHDHLFDRSLLNDFRKNYSDIDYFTILTPKVCEEIKGFMKDNTHTKCVVVPNFIQPEQIGDDIKPKRQVIAAGRLHPDKGFDSLLRAWKIVCEGNDDLCLKICGQGELLNELKSYAEFLGISDRVEFAGALPHRELLSEIKASVCYAMTSVTEAFPMVLLESLYCKTPAVAFDVRVGLDTVIDDTETGFIIADRDEDMLASKILELADNDIIRCAMSEKCAEKAKLFSKENVMKLWLDIIES